MKNRKKIAVLSMNIFLLQAVLFPLNAISYHSVNAEEYTLDSRTEETQSPDLNVNTIENTAPHFYFEEQQLTGNVDQLFSVKLLSDQAVKEVEAILPEGTLVDKAALPSGMTIENAGENRWAFVSQTEQTQFTLPLIFKSKGNYAVKVANSEILIEVLDPEEELTTEETVEESVEESQVTEETKEESTEESQVTEETAEEHTEESQTVEEGTKAEAIKTAAKEKNRAVAAEALNGTVEVSSMEDFRKALANPDVTTISIQKDIAETSGDPMNINRSVLIQGNGHSLNFDNNTLYFNLMSVNDKATIRIENAQLKKTGNNPLLQSEVTASALWTLELKDVIANMPVLASIPEGKLVFAGGTTQIGPSTAGQTLSTTKEVLAQNQAKVSIDRGNATVFSASAQVTAPKLIISDQSSMELTMATGIANGLDFSGANSEIVVQKNSTLQMNKSGATGTRNNNLINLSGEAPKVTVSEDSLLSLTTNSATTGLNLSGSNAAVIVNQSKMVVQTEQSNALAIDGENAKFSLTDSTVELYSTTGQELLITGDNAGLSLTNASVLNVKDRTDNVSTGNNNNIQVGNKNSAPSITIDKNSQLNVETKVNSGTAIYLSGSAPKFNINQKSQLAVTATGSKKGIFLEGADSEFHIKDSQIDLLASNRESLEFSGPNAFLEVADASKFKAENGNRAADTILLGGDQPKLEVSGKDTIFTAKSDANSGSSHRATLFLGVKTGSRSSNANLTFKDGAQVTIEAGDKAPAVGIYSSDGQFNVLNGTDVEIKNGNASEAQSGGASPIRFIDSGGYKFIIDHSKLKVSKTGGTAPGVRMYGGGNEITVQNGGDFEIYNPGSGIPQNGGNGILNQGIQYTGGSGNSFKVQDPGSQVKIVADFGAGLDMGSTNGEVSVIKGGYFEVIGQTGKNTGGIFNAGSLNVTFDNPLFMNFRNNRPSGGRIFNVRASSTLTATNSALSVWKNGNNLDNDPDLTYSTLDYSFSRAHFGRLGETSKPDILNEETFGKDGLENYSRMSSNNGEWAIADELRIPTNADKKIYGRVSLPVGLNDSRPAWTDEAVATVEVETKDGKKKEYTAQTVGHTETTPGISMYGEEPRGGLFEIDLDAPLEKGSKVRIVDVALSSGKVTAGFENKILTDTVEVFSVIPPELAEFSSSQVPVTSKSIRGSSKNPDVEVTATHNGQLLDASNITLGQNGDFTINLENRNLKVDDKIQVFLRDNEGSAEAAGVINPPITNNSRGNINPDQELNYHDVAFKAATTLIVANSGPLAPVDPLNPSEEIEPADKPKVPLDQGPLSIDFVSQLNFGTQNISVNDQTYYAQPQKVVHADGTIDEKTERPNYVQISDNRLANERSGWQLSVTQNKQFTGEDGQELAGAVLQFTNQQLAAVNNGSKPKIQQFDSWSLTPGARKILLSADDKEGTGTWIYRFGNEKTGAESVKLNVPKGANPDASQYATTLTWELSAVPGN